MFKMDLVTTKFIVVVTVNGPTNHQKGCLFQSGEYTAGGAYSAEPDLTPFIGPYLDNSVLWTFIQTLNLVTPVTQEKVPVTTVNRTVTAWKDSKRRQLG